MIDGEEVVATPETDAEIAKIAEEVEQGRDSYTLPEELLEEAPEVRPVQKNLLAQIAALSVGEKLKLALKGHRDARTLLVRDANRIVRRFVLLNPRISEEEILALAKNRSIDRELLDTICKKKEWVTHYQIKLALVTNPKTPVGIALRLVVTLLPRDLRQLAKSKNVPGAVNGVAKRLIIERSGGHEEKRG